MTPRIGVFPAPVRDTPDHIALPRSSGSPRPGCTTRRCSTTTPSPPSPRCRAPRAPGRRALRLLPRPEGPGPRARARGRRHDRDPVPGGLASLRAPIGPDIPLVLHAVGSVADEGESLDSPRLRAAVGPVVAVAFHAFAEQPWRLEGLDPALQERATAYIAAVTAAYPDRRHQVLHRGHLMELTLPEDEAVVDAGTIAALSFTGTAERLRERAEGLARDGVTELAVQPGGDVPSELRRLAAALLP